MGVIPTRHHYSYFMWEHPGPFFSECSPPLGSQNLSDLTCTQHKQTPADLTRVLTELLGELEGQAKAAVGTASLGTQGPAIHATGKGLFPLLLQSAYIVDCLLQGQSGLKLQLLLPKKRHRLQLQPPLEHTTQPLLLRGTD